MQFSSWKRQEDKETSVAIIVVVQIEGCRPSAIGSRFLGIDCIQGFDHR